MPRTPSQAAKIGVALKRKKEYTNTHKYQLIDPVKLFNILNTLKENGNKYYQFHEDCNTHQKRSRETDPTGYDVIFMDEDKGSQGKIEIIDSNMQEVQDEISIDDERDTNE